ncbi:MAG: hypothetical protein RIE56_13710 [Amphiplicatus sp.]
MAAFAAAALTVSAVPGVASATPQSPVDAGLRIAGELVTAGVSNELTSLPTLAVQDDRGRRSGGDRGRRSDGNRGGGDRRGAGDRNRDRGDRRTEGRRDDRGDRQREARRDDRSGGRRDDNRNRYAGRDDRRDRRSDGHRDDRNDRYDDRRDRRNGRYDDRRDRRYVSRDNNRRYSSGRRYDYGHRHGHGPRGGHGYYCNDHFAFHYFTGYDPYGWRRASYRGYYPPRGCYLVERVEYRRGRRVLVGGYSCVDPYGYAYIQLGSQFVLRYY